MQVFYSSQFRTQYKKLPQKTRVQFKARLLRLLRDERHPSLRVYKLAGAYEGLRSRSLLVGYFCFRWAAWAFLMLRVWARRIAGVGFSRSGTLRRG